MWFLYFIISIVVLLFIFLLLREFNLWYWRINEKIDLLVEINSNLKKLIDPNHKKINTDSSIKKISNMKNKNSLNKGETKVDSFINCDLCGKKILKKESKMYLNSLSICKICWSDKNS